MEKVAEGFGIDDLVNNLPYVHYYGPGSFKFTGRGAFVPWRTLGVKVSEDGRESEIRDEDVHEVEEDIKRWFQYCNKNNVLEFLVRNVDSEVFYKLELDGSFWKLYITYTYVKQIQED